LVQAHGAGHVTGIDLEPDLIAKARVRIAQAQLADRIELIQVSPGRLPFADASSMSYSPRTRWSRYQISWRYSLKCSAYW